MNYAGAILKQEGKFLLQLRDDNPNISNPNKWGTFGGGIESGEKPLQAIKRELREELGLKRIKPRSSFKISMNGKSFFLYRVDLPRRNLKLREGQKIGHFSRPNILIKKGILPSVRLFFLFSFFLLPLFFKKI